MPKQLQEINFPYDDINCISRKQFDVHMDLYKGYIKKINEIWSKLAEPGIDEDANATYSRFRGLKVGETYALDGVKLHEMYFSNMGGANVAPDAQVMGLLAEHFGSFNAWREDFAACGKAARGWAVLAYDQRSKSFINFVSDAHDVGVVWNAYPVLIMDVYEHAYFVDYANKKADYINSFISDINWETVTSRIKLLKLL